MVAVGPPWVHDEQYGKQISAEVDAEGGTPAVTLSPMVAWILGHSPTGVHPLCITNSLFLAMPKDRCCNERVDAEADDFIRMFYE